MMILQCCRGVAGSCDDATTTGVLAPIAFACSRLDKNLFILAFQSDLSRQWPWPVNSPLNLSIEHKTATLHVNLANEQVWI
jgi:hypothetical protein